MSKQTRQILKDKIKELTDEMDGIVSHTSPGVDLSELNELKEFFKDEVDWECADELDAICDLFYKIGLHEGASNPYC